MANRKKGYTPDARTIEVLKASGSYDKPVALANTHELAKALELPLRQGILNGAGIYLVIAGDGTLYHTADFNEWEEVLTPLFDIDDGNWNDVIWTGNGFIAVGDDSAISFSTDGIGWTSLASAVNVPTDQDNFYSVLTNRTTGLIVGQNGQIHMFDMETSDVSGWTWTTIINPNEGQNREDLYDVTYSRKAYVAVGAAGAVIYSLNGVSWDDCGTMEGFDTNHDINAVTGRE